MPIAIRALTHVTLLHTSAPPSRAVGDVVPRAVLRGRTTQDGSGAPVTARAVLVP